MTLMGIQQRWLSPHPVRGLRTFLQVLILPPLYYSVAFYWAPHLSFLFLTDTRAREIFQKPDSTQAAHLFDSLKDSSLYNRTIVAAICWLWG